MTTNGNNSPRSAKRRVKHTRMDAAILEYAGPCGGQQRTTEQCLFKKKYIYMRNISMEFALSLTYNFPVAVSVSRENEFEFKYLLHMKHCYCLVFLLQHFKFLCCSKNRIILSRFHTVLISVLYHSH